MSDDELAAIEARAAAATPGPWWQKSHETPTGDGVELSRLLCYFEDEGDPRFWTWSTDGVFVAHARTDVPALLAEVRRLRSERDELQQNISDILGAVRRGEL